jgi:hypothetical protein
LKKGDPQHPPKHKTTKSDRVFVPPITAFELTLLKRFIKCDSMKLEKFES